MAGSASAARRRSAGTKRCCVSANRGILNVLEIDIPEILAEVTAVHARYEQALVTNDVATLNELFWDDARVLRYGTAENLYGYAAIRDFRNTRPPQGLARTVLKCVIVTYGRDFGTANIEFERNGRHGRQSQTWLRTGAGWRVVAAHVSLLPEV
jgi:hypothetical protein